MSGQLSAQSSIPEKNLQGTWSQAVVTFLLPIVLVFGIRWAVIEPFVIPSGSMIPSLLVHDHLFVKKFSFGLHWPFSDHWMVRWSEPKRGDIVVFKYPENPELYYIKRLIGLPGDTIKVSQNHISVNGQEWSMAPADPVMDSDADDFNYFIEHTPSGDHLIRMYKATMAASSKEEKVYQVPQGQYFFMGDNRDQSSDGRVWGFVPEKLLIGRAWIIWLSCEKMLASAPYLCQPDKIRIERLFKSVDAI